MITLTMTFDDDDDDYYDDDDDDDDDDDGGGGDDDDDYDDDGGGGDDDCGRIGEQTLRTWKMVNNVLLFQIHSHWLVSFRCLRMWNAWKVHFETTIINVILNLRWLLL